MKTVKVTRWVLSLLMIAIATNVSAQNYPRRGQGAYSSRPTRSSSQSDLGEAIVKGVGNLFKKKDKDKNKDREQPKKDKHPKGQPTTSENVTSTNAQIAPTTSTAKSKAKDDVELVVFGEGSTKDEATKVALRSAIEQAYGTFVSSNTNILNDNLIKDEIVTVSSGNIKSFKYISETQTDGKWNVTLQAVVSIGKLTSYVQQKGGETELAGATFAMDVKMKKLYKQNEEVALRHLMTQLNEIVPQMFDYSIEVGSPKASSSFRNEYWSEVKVTIKTNGNYTLARDLIWKTLGALCINNKDDVADFKEKGITPAIVQFFTCGNGQKTNLMTQLPVTYMELPWNKIDQEQYVFFRSKQFFSDFRQLINKVLGEFIVDVGFEKVTCCYKDYNGYEDRGKRCHFGTLPRDGYLNEPPSYGSDNAISIGYANCRNGSSCYFPVAKSAKWTLSGSVYFTLEELERVTNIKVYSESKK